jgi:hypothetical protein
MATEPKFSTRFCISISGVRTDAMHHVIIGSQLSLRVTQPPKADDVSLRATRTAKAICTL